MTTPSVMIDIVALDSVSAMGTSVEHMLEHHREHLASDCGCMYSQNGETAMRAPDGTVLVMSEREPGVFEITGHRP